ncbi:circadian clock-controlled protein daywake isoform X1 [Stomoxys calcitrans]|uniref:circadian clock-controlled protein daywake isoform X1 n=1 Tax=Stomoxys calcitrans TaxID=35570 RepID=UPI0027E36652|nr:circadian clock-controlled protein daywake isoform X1 [Stomoxys calcitrans]
MFKSVLACITIMGVLLECHSGELPSDIVKCKAGDNDCVRDRTTEVFKKFPKGNPAFGLPNISVLSLKNITVAKAKAGSPTQLNFKFLDLTVYGMERAITVNTTGWTKQPKTIEMFSYVDFVKMEGVYETNGKILLLTLNGKGNGVVELINCTVHTKLRFDFEQRNDGKRYAQASKLKAVVTPEKMVIKMENLVNGNKELTDTLNSVLNENWLDIWNELSDGIGKAISLVFKNGLNSVLNELSYDDFYSE